MGIAHGTLLKQQLNQCMPAIWAYLESQVEDILKAVPEWLAKIIADEGLSAALDLTWELTKKYSGEYFFQEMQGISDASGVDYLMIRRIHMIGELTRGACSMFGAWGAATLSTQSTLQLRALDWNVDGPFKDFPLVTIYHNEPSMGGLGQTFANAG